MNVKLAIAVAAILAAIAAPFFVYPVLLMTILCFVIFACSFNLLLGYAGLLCFGHAMFFGGSAYIAGQILKTTAVPLELALLGGVAAAALLGLVIGWLSMRRQGIQFAMITLAFSQFVYFILLQAPFTGGENGMQGIPRTAVVRPDRCAEQFPLLLRGSGYHGRDDLRLLPDRSLAIRGGAQGDTRQRSTGRIAGLRSGKIQAARVHVVGCDGRSRRRAEGHGLSVRDPYRRVVAGVGRSDPDDAAWRAWAR